MKVTVFVTPKKTVLDPQGAAVGHAMEHLGLNPSSDVRVGKTIEFDVDGTDTPELREQIDKICDGLLSNPVIEDYRYELA
ncbi:phosphoribosylformylglycinamidine synthase subunit PurS [Cerasicoccus fimbriatus]|uniref:phosphoribosylformylglycinamidine synthase subunit PurS n=1 Tax=Cerasicoccus fimbriatus TaxID=3014554 RepID=UPI0022B30861|nr:phosphoribosylformylglycinamidine synthase subunit PurS [Cerasicoccus sp. TK19100]